MDGSSVYADSHINDAFLKKNRVSRCSEVLDSVLVSNSSSPQFLGSSSSMVNFQEFRGENSKIDGKSDSVNDDNDECFRPPEKKRRLRPNQVQFLEKSFDLENKLEPDRKAQLAKDLGLHPRQVSIWFQNRRARFKTKLLEKDYDSLKACYDQLKADYETLFEENKELKNEIHSLNEKLPKFEHLHPVETNPKSQFFAPIPAPELGCKQEDAASTARSDVFDSDSPIYFEEDELSNSLLHLPKLEMECFDDLQTNSCNLGFAIQEHGSWFWPL